MSDRPRRKRSPRLPSTQTLQVSSAVYGVDKIALLQDDFVLVAGRSSTRSLQQLPLSCDKRRYFNVRKNFNRLSVCYRDVRQTLCRRDALERQRALLLEGLALEGLKTRLRLCSHPGTSKEGVRRCIDFVFELRGILERMDEQLTHIDGVVCEEVVPILSPLVTEVFSLVRKTLLGKTSAVLWCKEAMVCKVSELKYCVLDYNCLLDDILFENEKRKLREVSRMLACGHEPCVSYKLKINLCHAICDLLRHQALQISADVTKCLRDANELNVDQVTSLSQRLDRLVDEAVECVGAEMKSVAVNLCRSLSTEFLLLPGCSCEGMSLRHGVECDGCCECVKGSLTNFCVLMVLREMPFIGRTNLEELQSSWLSAAHMFNCHTMAESDWDRRFTHMLGVAASDKCLPSRTQPETVSMSTTTTTQLLVECLDKLRLELDFMARHLSTEDSIPHGCVSPVDHSVTLCVLERRLCQLVGTLQCAYLWLSSKSRHSLSTWNVSKMVIMIFCDLLVIEGVAQELKTVVGRVAAFGCNDCCQLSSSPVQLLEYIKDLKTDFQHQFESDCYRMCRDFWHQALPSKRTWRRKAKDAITDHSDYVDAAILQLLYPFTSGVCDVPADIQSQVLATSTTAAVESLKQCVFERKIVFSVDGAKQLHIDLCHFRDWIIPDNCLDVPDTVCVSVRELQCFPAMLHGISLMLHQQHGHKKSRFDSAYPESCSSPARSDHSLTESTSTDKETGSSERKDSGFSRDSSVVSEDGSDLSDGERWIRLRLHGSGRPKWTRKLNCFQTQSVT